MDLCGPCCANGWHCHQCHRWAERQKAQAKKAWRLTRRILATVGS